jgi:tRNA modification GTPase
MLSDPIVALATAPGRSALAIVRLSGVGAFEIAAKVIDEFSVEPARTGRLAAFLDHLGEAIDRGLYFAYPGPNSFTGDDTVECTCHGGLVVPARLLAAFEAAGARPARPGEFTRRALLNGKLDLLQAEAIGDLIDATAVAQARSALHQLDGGLSRRIAGLRQGLLDLLALLDYDVDFPEEDDGPIPRERILAAMEAQERDVGHLLATAPVGERLTQGALVVLAGRPNVGKSSLFNALLGTERALVTAVPGTTRDTIEAQVEFEGWPVRLADTAGLWEAPDALDRLGVEVSRRYLGAADLVLFCVGADGEVEAGDLALLESLPSLLVRTKADRRSGAAAEGNGIPVSAVTGEGLDHLRIEVTRRLFDAGKVAQSDLEPMLTRERHRLAMKRALAELLQARALMVPEGEPVLVAHHVRQAALALDELIGAVDVEEVLDRVFSRFCVGK